MANLGREVYSFRDFSGQVETTSLFVHDATLAAGLGPLMAAVSNATNNAYRGPANKVDDGTKGVNAEFPNVEDKMVLIFKGTGGSTHKLNIPAPLLANFDTDGETVNNAGDVATLTAAIVAVGCDAGGAVYTSFLRGHRARRVSKRG
jgi:hypothetical protein